jgi:RNA polymerase sigma factor (sigma-70 family)
MLGTNGKLETCRHAKWYNGPLFPVIALRPSVNIDTDLGGPADRFPATRCSVLRAVTSPDAIVRRQAQETLVSAYWKPVYKYLRMHWQLANEDAKDLTQGFFTLALDKSFFDRFDPAKARFRTFLRVCVDGFVSKEQRAASRMKRGGEAAHESLDFAGADAELQRHIPAPGADPDDLFRQEWLRSLFSFAVEDFRKHCLASAKEKHFQVFQRYDLEAAESGEPLTYAQLAEELGLSTTQVTNYLAFSRTHFRKLLLDRLRATTGNDDEYQLEVRNLFGGEIR